MAGHAGGELQARAVAALDLPVLVDDERPRADEAHLAAQDVMSCGSSSSEVLRRQPADARDTRVVGDLEQAGVLIAVQMQRRLAAPPRRRPSCGTSAS